MKIYLIAKKLSHSFSPEIHRHLADYSYELKELEEDELKSFFEKRQFDGLNVTVPYKTAVMKYLDFISPEAEKIGAVNTVVNKDGKLYGYNTDYFGFMYTIKKSGAVIEGKKVVIIGNGGASRPVRLVCETMGAQSVRIITRKENTPEGIKPFLDGEIVINATPVGMYPDTLVSPVNLYDFKNCQYVFDLIYNPKKTKLLLDAEKLNIPYMNGLCMLVAQAKEACGYFTGEKRENSLVEDILKILDKKTSNIVLVGMPGSGKTVIGKEVSKMLGREFFDCDEEISRLGKTPAEIINESGEAEFRKLETKVLNELCKKSGIVIATGGGAVTVRENHDIIRQNAFTVFIERDLSLLCTEGRPLSKSFDAIEALWEKRRPLYQSISDAHVNVAGITETAEIICELFNNNGGEV